MGSSSSTSSCFALCCSGQSTEGCGKSGIIGYAPFLGPVPSPRYGWHYNSILHTPTSREKGERSCWMRLPQLPGGGKPKLLRPKDQPTLHQLVAKAMPDEECSARGDEGTSIGRDDVVTKGGTRNFSRFNLDDPTLKGFSQYQQGIDGNKSVKSAQEVTIWHQQVPTVSFAVPFTIMD